jgi:hypothetical protein
MESTGLSETGPEINSALALPVRQNWFPVSKLYNLIEPQWFFGKMRTVIFFVLYVQILLIHNHLTSVVF